MIVVCDTSNVTLQYFNIITKIYKWLYFVVNRDQKVHAYSVNKFKLLLSVDELEPHEEVDGQPMHSSQNQQAWLSLQILVHHLLHLMVRKVMMDSSHLNQAQAQLSHCISVC